MKRLSLKGAAPCAAAILLCVCTLPAPAQEETDDVAIDPLTDIALDMEAVVADLSVQETGDTTQETQAIIVKKLDALIEQLERELEAGAGAGSGANPQRPLQDSMIIGGPGGIGDLRTPRDLGKNWGELPAKERERILQSLTEGFPPHYQKILEHYYRRLAAEQTAGDAGSDGDERRRRGSAAEGGGDENRASESSIATPGDSAAASDTSGPVGQPARSDTSTPKNKSKRPAAKKGSKRAGEHAAAEGSQ